MRNKCPRMLLEVSQRLENVFALFIHIDMMIYTLNLKQLCLQPFEMACSLYEGHKFIG